MSYFGDRAASFSGTFISVTGSLAPSVVMPNNPQRTGFTMFNDSNQTAYFGYCAQGNMNTTNKFTGKIASQTQYDCPQERPYFGPVSVVWQSLPTTGSLNITELC